MQSDQEIRLTIKVSAQADKADVAKLQDAIEHELVESGIVASIEWSSFRQFR